MARRPAPAPRRSPSFGRRRPSGRPRRSFTIALLVLASITIITLDFRGGGQGAINALRRGAHDTFAPVQRGVDAVVRPIGNFIAGAVHYGSVEHQNAIFQRELGELQREVAEGQASRQELQTLERLEHLPWAGNVQTVPALVVALNPSDFVASVQLDQGTASGVEKGMPVVGGAGLVGVVTQAWSSGSTVQLITDPASVIDVRFGTNPDDVAVVGQGTDSPLTVNYIRPGTTVSKGEILTTSGLPTLAYPPGIPVARIKKYSSSPSASQETVSATPLADLSALQYVDVMLWESPS